MKNAYSQPGLGLALACWGQTAIRRIASRYNKYFVSQAGCLLLRWVVIIIYGMSQKWGYYPVW